MADTNPKAFSRSLTLGAAVLLAMPFASQCSTTPVGTTSLGGQNNTAPVSRIRPVEVASIGSPLTLIGIDSYDPDGDELKYHWSLAETPEGSELSDAPFSASGDRNAGVTTFSPDVAGLYTVALQVEDTPAGALSESDFVTFVAASSVDLPIAEAGVNQTGLEGSEVCLDGGGSFDPNGHELTYEWSLVSVPGASTLTSADIAQTDASACLTPDAPGSYALALVVDNGIVESEPDFAFLAAGSTNQGPEALASIINEHSCDFIQVSGLGSTDPEDDTLYYDWQVLQVPNGSGVALGASAWDDNTLAEPTFYADVEGEYTVQLVVNDGEDYSTPVFVDLHATITTVNEPPVVRTTEDSYYSSASPTCSVDSYGNCQNCPSCAPVIVDMNAWATTDPDDDQISVRWEIVDGPANSGLLLEEGFENQLTLPGPPGSCTPSTVNTYQVQVRVTAQDCLGAESSDLITVVYDCGG